MGIESMSVMGMPVIVVFELLEVVKLVVEVCWLKVLERWTLVSLQARRRRQWSGRLRTQISSEGEKAFVGQI